MDGRGTLSGKWVSSFMVEVHGAEQGIAAVNIKLKVHLLSSQHLVICATSATGIYFARTATTSNISAALISGERPGAL